MANEIVEKLEEVFSEMREAMESGDIATEWIVSKGFDSETSQQVAQRFADTSDPDIEFERLTIALLEGSFPAAIIAMRMTAFTMGVAVGRKLNGTGE